MHGFSRCPLGGVGELPPTLTHYDSKLVQVDRIMLLPQLLTDEAGSKGLSGEKCTSIGKYGAASRVAVACRLR
jgi:hypothetical protein